MGSLLQVQVRRLSLGERMKMELIAALLHRPELLYLDEPTIGLDILSQRSIRDFLRHYNRQTRTTILLTSHYTADIEAICPRSIIINHGSVVFDGPLGEVSEVFGHKKLVSIKAGRDLTARIVAAGFENEVAGDIKDGGLSRYLIRPVSYSGYCFARFLGSKAADIGLPLAVTAAVLAGSARVLGVPFPPVRLGLYGLSLAGALALNFSIFYTVALLGFWLTESWSPASTWGCTRISGRCPCRCRTAAWTCC